MEIIKNYTFDAEILNDNAVVFDKFVRSNFDYSIYEIQLKHDHTLRVAKMSRDIAKKLGLDTDLAYTVGLLHDYARFEQWITYSTFADKKSVDHAELAVEKLFINNEIKKFRLNESDYLLVKLAIKFHNKAEIDFDYIREQVKLDKTNTHSYEEIANFAKLIRDTDKMDIFNCVANNAIHTAFKKDGYTQSVVDRFNDHKFVFYHEVQTKLDNALSFLGFLYDMNFKESVEEIRIDNYIKGICSYFNTVLNDEDKALLKQFSNQVLDWFKK